MFPFREKMRECCAFRTPGPKKGFGGALIELSGLGWTAWFRHVPTYRPPDLTIGLAVEHGSSITV